MTRRREKPARQPIPQPVAPGEEGVPGKRLAHRRLPAGPVATTTRVKNAALPRTRARNRRCSASATGPRGAQQTQPTTWPGFAAAKRTTASPSGAGASPSINSASPPPAVPAGANTTGTRASIKIGIDVT